MVTDTTVANNDYPNLSVFDVTENKMVISEKSDGKPKLGDKQADISMENKAQEALSKENITHIPIEKLKPFKDQAFKRLSNEKFNELMNSISEVGVLNPIIVRRKGDVFEILSGSNRANACSKLGFKAIPGIIKDCDDNEAVLIMTESNLCGRDKIFPSESAKAYFMQYEATKRQGIRTSAQNEHKYARSAEDDNKHKYDAAEIVAKRNGVNKSEIRRYIKLVNLIKEFQSLIDEKRLPISTAVVASDLSGDNQKLVYNFFFAENRNLKLNTKKMKKIKLLAEINNLTTESLNNFEISIPTQKTFSVKIKLDRLQGKVKQEDLPNLVTRLLNDHIRKCGDGKC